VAARQLETAFCRSETSALITARQDWTIAGRNILDGERAKECPAGEIRFLARNKQCKRDTPRPNEIADAALFLRADRRNLVDGNSANKRP
jgi:hypothetical protein